MTAGGGWFRRRRVRVSGDVRGVRVSGTAAGGRVFGDVGGSGSIPILCCMREMTSSKAAARGRRRWGQARGEGGGGVDQALRIERERKKRKSLPNQAARVGWVHAGG